MKSSLMAHMPHKCFLIGLFDFFLWCWHYQLNSLCSRLVLDGDFVLCKPPHDVRYGYRRRHTLCQCIIHPQFISGSLCEGSLTILLRFLPTHSRRCTTCKLALHLNIRPHASSILCHLHLLNLLASSTCIFYLHLLSISSASPQHLPLESPVSLFGLPLSSIQPLALSLPISAMDFIFTTLSVSRRVSCSVSGPVSMPAFTFAV